MCVGDVAMGRGLSDDTWEKVRAAPGRTKVLVVGNHDVTGQGLLRVVGFHRVKAVLYSAGDPPLIWTHAPLPNVPAGHVNVHGHQHAALKPADSPHINVSVEQSITAGRAAPDSAAREGPAGRGAARRVRPLERIEEMMILSSIRNAPETRLGSMVARITIYLYSFAMVDLVLNRR